MDEELNINFVYRSAPFQNVKILFRILSNEQYKYIFIQI